MTKLITFLHDGDAYELDIDVDTMSLRSIWRYANNRTQKPEICIYKYLDQTLKDKIDDKLIREYGDQHSTGVSL